LQAALNKTSLALIVGAIGTGVALAPFSGGTSLAISGITATAVGVTTGVGAAVIILVASLGVGFIIAIYKDYDVKAKVTSSDGSVVELEFTKKNS